MNTVTNAGSFYFIANMNVKTVEGPCVVMTPCSVIGIEKIISLANFVSEITIGRREVITGDLHICMHPSVATLKGLHSKLIKTHEKFLVCKLKI